MATPCPQLQHLPDNVKAFWEDKQRDLDDTLLLFSYSIMATLPNFPFPEITGILYLMQRDLWFEDFPKPPLFFLNRPSKYQKTLIQIPRTSITEVQLLRQSALEAMLRDTPQQTPEFLRKLSRFFSRDPYYLVVTGVSMAGKAFQYAFREVNDPDSWLQTLQGKHP
jgi:hypothetical protein